MTSPPSSFARPSRRGVIIGAASLLSGCSEAAAGPVPRVVLPPIKGLNQMSGWPVPGVDTNQFAGRITVLNIWASWCPYCRGEHDLLKRLAGMHEFKLVGLVYRDTEAKARDYLLSAGNPFAAVSMETGGTLTSPLRQSGVPHSYVIGRDLKVLAKVPGALTDHAIDQVIRPAVMKGLQGTG